MKNDNELITEFMKHKGRNALAHEFQNSMGLPYKDYHNSWDWLMPVVEKLESLGYQFVFTQSKIGFLYEGEIVCIIGSEEPKIKRTFEAVTDTIKHYLSK